MVPEEDPNKDDRKMPPKAQPKKPAPGGKDPNAAKEPPVEVKLIPKVFHSIVQKSGLQSYLEDFLLSFGEEYSDFVSVLHL